MNRIEALCSYIELDDKVVDVGCDQAKLSIMLAKRKQKSIASDISSKVIETAKSKIDSSLVDLRVSNGLDNIKSGEADTLVLAGMGTHTIIEILSNTNLRFKKIITISNNYHDILRKKMNDLDYRVLRERIVKENNKFYNLIVFTKGNYKYSEEELLLGMNQDDVNLYREYLEYLLKKYSNIKTTSKNKNKKINTMIKCINSKLEYLR